MKPLRMNLVEIVLRRFSKEDTVWDEDFREPLGGKDRSKEIVLFGQANFGEARSAFQRRDPSFTGDRAESRGHLVFAKADLGAAGVEVQKGDQVLRIAGVEMDLLVVEVRHESPLDGGFLLVVAKLEENREARASL